MLLVKTRNFASLRYVNQHKQLPKFSASPDRKSTGGLSASTIHPEYYDHLGHELARAAQSNLLIHSPKIQTNRQFPAVIAVTLLAQKVPDIDLKLQKDRLQRQFANHHDAFELYNLP